MMRSIRQKRRPVDEDAPLLRVDGLHAAYGKHRVLTDVSFSVGSGEFVSLVGPNGSGKSTLLRVLMSLLPTTAGSVWLNGRRVDGLSTPDVFRLGVGMAFQKPRVFGALSVFDNMMVAKQSAGLKMGSPADAMELLERVNLATLSRRRAGELSVGQQKLLDLARVAMNRPRLFLLDEVTAGVHPDLIPAVMELAMQCVGTDGATILVTHEMPVARRYTTRLLALHNGQIVADGLPDVVLADARVVETYIGV